MNIITNPSFEDGSNGWTLAGVAAVRSDLGSYDGLAALYMERSSLGPVTSLAQQDGMDLTLAASWPVTFYGKAISGTTTVQISIDDGTGVYAAVDSKEITDTAWTEFDCGSFLANGALGGIRFSTILTDGVCLIDLVRIGTEEPDVAILLAERAVRRVIASLKANLPTELTAVETDMLSEFSETVSIDAPANANYYAYPKAEVAGAAVHVEVFEAGFDSLNPYTDAAAARSTYEVPVTVRLTHFNRDGSSAATMMQRMRLYGAAIHRVLLEQYTLGGTDDAIKLSVPVRYTPFWEFEGEDAQKVRKVQVVINAAVRCEEVSA